MRGGIDLGDHHLGPRFVRIAEILNDFDNRGWDLILPDGVGFYTVLGGVDPGLTVSVVVPGILELQMCGNAHDPGIGPCPPRVALGHARSMAGRIPIPHQPSGKSQHHLANG